MPDVQQLVARLTLDTSQYDAALQSTRARAEQFANTLQSVGMSASLGLTAPIAMLAKTGACSYAGPMLLADFAHAQLVDFTVDDFSRCLAGPTHAIGQDAGGNPVLDVTGTIWGGNLAMLMSLLGTFLVRTKEGGDA